MPPTPRPIPTPLFVRWQRVQFRLVPFIAVALAAAAAWRLWREVPRTTAIGQVDVETVNIHAPTAGEASDPPHGQPTFPHLLDRVAAGQILARIHTPGDQWADVTATAGGQVVKIHTRAGDAVTAGQTLFTLAGDRGLSITTYVRSDQRVRPEPGMTVEVRQRSDSAKTFRAAVERVGPQYEPIPAAQLRDKKAEDWGLPVVISIPPDADLKPGELVYIGWPPGR